LCEVELEETSRRVEQAKDTRIRPPDASNSKTQVRRPSLTLKVAQTYHDGRTKYD
jgi:hypothetical protein